MNPIQWIPSTEDLMRICSLTGLIWAGRYKQRGFGSRQGPHWSTTICGRTWKRSFSIQKASDPDFIQPWLLGNTAPNFPVRQLISEPFSISSWASQKSILLTVPFSCQEPSQETKPSELLCGWVVSLSLLLLSFQLLSEAKKRNCWVIQHLRSWRAEFTTGEKFRSCSVPAMEEPGVWNGAWLGTGLKD